MWTNKKKFKVFITCYLLMKTEETNKFHKKKKKLLIFKKCFNNKLIFHIVWKTETIFISFCLQQQQQLWNSKSLHIFIYLTISIYLFFVAWSFIKTMRDYKYKKKTLLITYGLWITIDGLLEGYFVSIQ